MPFDMGDYFQSAVVQGTLYVGGGSDRSDQKNDVIMQYRPSTCRWNTLPPCKTQQFALTAIHDQLVIVGGITGRSQKPKSTLEVCEAGKKWVADKFLKMPTGRSHCSAIVYCDWLAVAGGRSEHKKVLDSVILLDTHANSLWYEVSHPMPVRFHSMKSALVGDSWYLMGGWTCKTGTTNSSVTEKVYGVSFHELLSDALLGEGHAAALWEEIHGLNCTFSTPLSFRGSLLAFGGKDITSTCTASIQILSGREMSASRPALQVLTGQWEGVAEIPAALYNCTCAVVGGAHHSVLLVAGGDDGEDFTDRCAIATL